MLLGQLAGYGTGITVHVCGLGWMHSALPQAIAEILLCFGLASDRDLRFVPLGSAAGSDRGNSQPHDRTDQAGANGFVGHYRLNGLVPGPPHFASKPVAVLA